MSFETQEQDLLAKKIKHGLENWREIILPVYDVLLWKNIPLYPAIIFGVSTALFVFILVLDPTLLSFVSSVCLVAVISDFVAPLVISRVFNPESWTGPKEKKLDEICANLASTYVSVTSDLKHFYGLKDAKPKVYYAVVIIGLLVLAWIGNNINNVFLTYVFLTGLLMLPGLKYTGYWQKYTALVRQTIAQTLRSVTSATKKDKKQ